MVPKADIHFTIPKRVKGRVNLNTTAVHAQSTHYLVRVKQK